MADIPTLFVCHGDDGGPRAHPCRRVQEALRAAGIEYDKVIADLRADLRGQCAARTRDLVLVR